jgi:hypothetical protein
LSHSEVQGTMLKNFEGQLRQVQARATDEQITTEGHHQRERSTHR